jgi:cytochrome P450
MLSQTYTVSQAATDAFLNGMVAELYHTGAGAAGGSFTLPVFADAESIQAILVSPAQFPKVANMGLLDGLGESRFTANGQNWEVRRSLTLDAYSQAGSSNHADAVAKIYREQFASCDSTVEGVQGALLRASSAIFFRALGCDADTGNLLEWFASARLYLKRLQYFSWNAPNASDASAIQREAGDIIKRFSEAVSRSPSLVTLMNTYRDQARDLMAFDPLSELLMNFLAGVETTAATLSFAIDRLGVDARVQQRLHKELDGASGSEVHLGCFIRETMRYFPAIPFVLRETAAACVLNGVSLSAGDKILLSIVGLHRNPLYWSEPEIFDCSRREFMDHSWNRRAFLPFLAGPRMCGGARLANLELIEALKVFVRQFVVSGSSDAIGFDYGLALRPGSSQALQISRRSET